MKHSQGSLLLWAIIHEDNAPCLSKLSEELFLKDELDFYNKVTNHYKKYKAIPRKKTVIEDMGFQEPSKEVLVEKADFYAEVVKDRYARTKLANFLADGVNLAVADTVTIQTEVSKLLADLTTVKENNFYSDMADNLRDSLDRAKENRFRDDLLGLPLGFGEVDNMLLGVHPTDIVTLHAESGLGKSWLTLHMLVTMHSVGKKILYINMEMGKEESADRLLGMLTGINADHIMTGQINFTSFPKIEKVINEFKNRPSVIFIDGDMRFSTKDLVAAILKYQPDVIFADGIYLMEDGSNNKHKQMWEVQANVLKELKQINKQFKVPIICTTQSTRESIGKDKKASQANAAGGLTIVRNSSVIFEVRNCESDSNFYQITVTKSRRNVPKNLTFLMRKEMDIHRFTFAGFTDTPDSPNLIGEEMVDLEKLEADLL